MPRRETRRVGRLSLGGRGRREGYECTGSNMIIMCAVCVPPWARPWGSPAAGKVSRGEGRDSRTANPRVFVFRPLMRRGLSSESEAARWWHSSLQRAHGHKGSATFWVAQTVVTRTQSRQVPEAERAEHAGATLS